MYPLLGRFGPFFLYSYQYVWGAGILAALALAYHLAPRPRQWRDWFDPLLAGLIAGILGGRAAYVGLNWAYFQSEPAEIWQIWRGGLTYHGALLAGLLAVWQCQARGEPRTWHCLVGANTLALLLPLLHATGWAACFLHGCGYGRPAAPGGLAVSLPDSFGVVDLRYPTQLLGMGFSFLVWLLIARGQRRANQRLVDPSRQRAYSLFWLALLLLMAGNLALWFWRGDRQSIMGVILDAGIAAAALIALTINRNSTSGRS